MRTAIQGTQKAQGRLQISHAASVPAPIGGWNARDSLAAMKPTDAIKLDNWFPQPTYVEIRGGYSSHATGMTQNGKTLLTYNRLTGTNQFFCMTGAGTYNVSSTGAVGASVLARTNGKHQWKMFGDGTNNWLIACNGVDAPAYYDGTTWTAVTGATTPALTGVTTTELVVPIVFKGRLMFIQINTLSFWYLAAGAAGGALTEFDMSAEFKRGGYLMAAENWTRDAGDGADDVMVFVSSEGEAVVYQGTNPAAASTWAKIGTYFIGRPIGRRCLAQFGGDLVVLTENGAFPMSAALQAASIDYKLALSFKIEKEFTYSARTYSSVFGWKPTVFPAQNALIVNIPKAEDGEHEQYVMNTITKAWCRFLEWDAEDFGLFNGELYFTAGTTVYKAWTGQIDGANNIEAYAKQAFSHFGQPGVQKHFVLFRPMLATNGSLQYLTDIDMDFQDDPIAGTATYTVVSGAKWDVDTWNGSYWASGVEVVKQWTTPAEWAGYWAAGKLKVTTNSLMVQWTSSDYVYTKGGVV